MSAQIWVLLNGGPFDKEYRQIANIPDAAPPETLRFLDAVEQFIVIAQSEPGTSVPISYAIYNRTEFGGSGVWRYEFAEWSHGQFTAGV